MRKLKEITVRETARLARSLVSRVSSVVALFEIARIGASSPQDSRFGVRLRLRPHPLGGAPSAITLALTDAALLRLPLPLRTLRAYY